MRDIAKYFVKTPNMHLVGCLDPNASPDSKRAVYARVPFNATSIRFLCGNCHRYHIWAIDPKLREQVKQHK